MSEPLVMDGWVNLKQWLKPKLEQGKVTTVSLDVFHTLFVPLVSEMSLKRSCCRQFAQQIGHAERAEELLTNYLQLESYLSEQAHSMGLDKTYRLTELLRLLNQVIPSLNEKAQLQVLHEVVRQAFQRGYSLSPDALDFVQWLTRQNVQWLVVSDTCWDQAWLEHWLQHNKVTLDTDELYLSSTNLQTIESGRLLQNVAAEMGVPQAQWLHISAQDIEAAKVMSDLEAMQSVVVQSGQSEAAVPVPEEEPTQQQRGEYFFDLVRQVSQRRGTKLPRNERDELIQAMCCVFVLALQERLEKATVDKVFFVSSDGLLFKQMYDELDTQADCEVIYLSPTTCDLASAVNGLTLDQFNQLGSVQAKPIRLMQLCERFVLPQGQVNRLALRHGIPNLEYVINQSDDRRSRRFWDDTEVQAMLIARAKQQRDILKAYLKQIDFFSMQQAVFVGLGASTQMQKQLEALFDSVEKLPAIQGYYLATDTETLEAILASHIVINNPIVTGYQWDAGKYQPRLLFTDLELTIEELQDIRLATLAYWDCFREAVLLSAYSSDDLLPFIQQRLAQQLQPYKQTATAAMPEKRKALMSDYIRSTLKRLLVR